ncbi:NAD(P)H-dependent oxidoreductase [Rhodococcus sp. X156]|uniref:NADPH-dependent FMN reductase n=1 Tax=Rhodococcus sp. X156 TaxID=2499145 RepID=UPI0019D2E852|nr:NAD(P)H-dependent oxidoreductase [Rhodococcus sp. X156]
MVGIGGSTRSGSQSERALRVVLAAARELGAETTVVTGADLVMPFYDPALTERTDAARALVDAVREADGVVLSSPGYHGTISGLVKNALDYVEDLRQDARPYLDGRAVGCVATAYGWQASVTTLTALRSVVHALRGWPTPLGAAVNSAVARFDDDGGVSDATVANNLGLLAAQVVGFARQQPGRPLGSEAGR